MNSNEKPGTEFTTKIIDIINATQSNFSEFIRIDGESDLGLIKRINDTIFNKFTPGVNLIKLFQELSASMDGYNMETFQQDFGKARTSMPEYVAYSNLAFALYDFMSDVANLENEQVVVDSDEISGQDIVEHETQYRNINYAKLKNMGIYDFLIEKLNEKKQRFVNRLNIVYADQLVINACISTYSEVISSFTRKLYELLASEI
jgi:hypothetical protein